MKTNRKLNQLPLIFCSVLTFLILTCVSVSTSDYANLGKGTDIIPLTGRALTGKLPNGLRYYILENSLPENMAQLALVVNAGSVLEREDQRGLAHFVEHLAFDGTKNFPNKDIIEYFRSLGMRFGGDANAYTSYDETVYHFDIPVENVGGVKRIPDKALAVLNDWTYTVSFLSEDVKNESRVVLEELRSRSDAMDRARKKMLKKLFSGSAYAEREPIGLAEIIENATSENVREFYERWYASDNMALVFVGDFDGKKLEAQLAQKFTMPAASKPVNRPLIELPPPKNGNLNVEIITDPELTSANYMIYYKMKKGSQKGTLAYYRETVIDYLIDYMLSLRFEEAQSDPESAANEFWGGVWRWSANARFYSMGTEPKTGRVEDALRELLLEKESMRRFGFTESELELAKLDIVSYMEKLVSEKDRTESRKYIRNFTNHFLYGEDMPDVEWEANAVNALLPGIGLKEVLQAAKDYFSDNDITVFLISPQAEAENLPTAEKIKSIFRETQSAKITRKQDNLLSGDLMDKAPTAGEITSENIDSGTGAHIIILSNGAKVIFKETANKNNEIVLYAAAKGGTANATEKTIFSVDLLSEMITASGLGPYSRNELSGKLAGKQVSASFWNSHYYRGFQGSSTTGDLKTLFQMIHLFFTQPRLDEKAISAMLDQYRTTLLHQNDDPQAVFFREFAKIIYNNHPLFKPLEYDDIAKVSIKDANDFLKQCINPGDYTFVFTGNVNLNVIRELSAIYIASIPVSQPMNKWNNPGIKRPNEGRKTINKGKEDRSMVFLAWIVNGPADFSEQRNQTASLLSEYLEIILNDEIREKLGGVYSISSGASANTIPSGEYSISVYFVCNPSRVEELITAVRDILTGLTKHPLNQDTFNKSKEALLKEHERSLQRNLYIAQSYTNSSVLYNTPLSRVNSRADAIKAVTPQSVQSLCREILVSGPVQVVLFPEKQ
ncbi:M16 family metallopeptidase [Treponema sp. R80B11-R83G3]